MDILLTHGECHSCSAGLTFNDYVAISILVHGFEKCDYYLNRKT
jgi:hypothetical protein